MMYFEKSQPAPACLALEKEKAYGDYKCGDVLSRIQSDFRNKCYICESKEPVTINVEHFVPHEGDKALKFSWDNLFWACGHCNNIKSNRFKDIINCTDLNERIEDRIEVYMRPFPKETVSVQALDTDPSTIATVSLLEAVYNGTTKLKTIESANLRSCILAEIRDFQRYLTDYYEDGFTPEDKALFLSNIKRHLSRSANFTSFKRNIVLGNEVMRKDFEQYFD